MRPGAASSGFCAQQFPSTLYLEDSKCKGLMSAAPDSVHPPGRRSKHVGRLTSGVRAARWDAKGLPCGTVRCICLQQQC